MKYSISLLMILMVGFSGCSMKQDTTEQTQVSVPYSAFEKASVISVQKVLVDGSYETIIESQTTRQKTSGEKTLFKTVVYFKDKSYTLFLSSELPVGSFIEFIFKDGQMTKIQLP